MNINFVDAELNVKIKETFKYILKKNNVKISFNETEKDINESTTIKLNDHNFLLEKIINNINYKSLNDKYYQFLTKKTKNNLSNLSTDKIKKKYFYLFIFKPFFGNLFLEKNYEYIYYKMTYNAVVIDLTKLEYDRFNYYSKYVYKLQQLSRLNKELKINQEFNIIFDDDKAAYEMYNNIYDNFKDIIEPLNQDYNKNINEDEDDLEDLDD